MGKGLKILIIGLPLFAKRIATDLAEFDQQNSYIALDTYYSKLDKIKYYFKVRNADIVYSINGTLTKSGTIDLALKLNKKVIMHWVGTDVIKSTQAFNENNYITDYIKKCTHWCEVDWIKNELKAINIDANIVNFAGFNINQIPSSLPKQFSVLTYIAQKRADYYGLNEIKQLATDFPNIQFNVMGSKFEFKDIPNLHFLGWIDNGSELIDNSTVCIRYTEHDGLSNFILEALSKGKHVLYNNPFMNVVYCQNYTALKENLNTIYTAFNEKNLDVNTAGYNYIKKYFNTQLILSNLIEQFKLIASNKN